MEVPIKMKKNNVSQRVAINTFITNWCKDKANSFLLPHQHTMQALSADEGRDPYILNLCNG
jgi:hypothetical protein